MFECLPIITDDNLNAVVAREVDHFQDLLERCTKETSTPDDAIICMCSELSKINPNLVRAISGAAYSVFKELEEHCSPEIAWAGGLAAVPGVLVALRIVDRALEATKLEAKIVSVGDQDDSSNLL